jgi:predicted metal-dependent enzyme (double-stranded beta helix superfamily)
MIRDTLDAAVDRPVRALLEAIAGPAAGDVPDMAAIGSALAAFAGDIEYLQRWVERLDPDGGGLAIHAPVRGPRLLLVRRPEGEMGPVHDHRVWVALAAVNGLETHRQYRRDAADDATMPALAETLGLGAGDVVTMLPPDDIHDHGHLAGHGQPAHVLVMTGDDQRRYPRNEWDLASARHRVLVPGDGGRFLASDPMPGDSTVSDD